MYCVVLLILFSTGISFAAVDLFFAQFKKVDDQLGLLNAATAELAWKSLTLPSPNSDIIEQIEKLNQLRVDWKRLSCDQLREIDPEKAASERAFKLLCRGPMYTPSETRRLSEVIYKLRETYQTRVVCFGERCLHGEPDLARIMARSRNIDDLLNVWLSWRDAVGPPSRALYAQLVDIMNSAARRNGYPDIGVVWREELEIENLENKMEEISAELAPLYKALHAVVRYRLRKFYGSSEVSDQGPIPAHLLGNMWGQSWSEIFDIVYPGGKRINLSEDLKSKYTVSELVLKAEDFYVSLGFKPMPDSFWRNSRWNNTLGNCHGTAVNMFEKDDFRIVLCAEVGEEDLHVIYHEMGHIEYFMEYQHQLSIFKDGANSAVQEAVGEAVAMAASTIANIERLGLLNDENIEDKDLQLLLHFGLRIIPQIPYSLLVDKWRWNVFRGDISTGNYNKAWWALRKSYQGISAPVPRSEDDFDPAAKFHISDNVPYARYFIATVLQFQIFETMCKAEVFGDAYSDKTILFPLHQCDIYGSMFSSDTIRAMMQKGSSTDFNNAVRIVSNKSFTVQPLLYFFEPLKKWLDAQIELYDIPVGWN